MSGRRKHRVLVEVTFDRNVSAKIARNSVLSGLSIEDMNVYGMIAPMAVIQTVKVKEAERVIQAEINWKNRRSSSDS